MYDNLSELRTYLTKNMFLKPVDSNMCEMWHNRYNIILNYNKLFNREISINGVIFTIRSV